MGAELALLAVSLIGTGVAYYGQTQQAKAAEETAEYNADMLRRQGRGDSEIAASNMRRQAKENARFMASVRAEQAKSGFSLAGTPLAVLGDMQTELDQQLSDSSFKSAQRQQQLREQAKMVSFEGAALSSAQNTQAVASLAGGLASTGVKAADSFGFIAPRSTKTTI